jgi:hypothetical protein
LQDSQIEFLQPEDSSTMQNVQWKFSLPAIEPQLLPDAFLPAPSHLFFVLYSPTLSECLEHWSRLLKND